MEARDIQMKYTIDNPKIVYDYIHPEEDNFTGVVKDGRGHIAYYENGEHHRTDGPAIIRTDGGKIWFIHGKCHREDGPAVQYYSGYKEWYYNDESYGYNDDFTTESWIKKCKLEIFK